ncbi:MAG TPA: DUF2934 domain-containing protein [Blastocatellia bacterium]|nr:DUF2934 domain-containing protein [Blastocatellia bacterium]
MSKNELQRRREELPGSLNLRERTAALAYEIYLTRGGEHGRDMGDWLQAESEVLASLIEEQPVPSRSDSGEAEAETTSENL